MTDEPSEQLSSSQQPEQTRDLHKELKLGIAGFYDRSSKLWEDVWGEHMHHVSACCCCLLFRRRCCCACCRYRCSGWIACMLLVSI
jgi:hypothetical protein